ncbi:hypothetical protein P0F65_10085 [Sphingomonas sp. I4]
MPHRLHQPTDADRPHRGQRNHRIERQRPPLAAIAHHVARQQQAQHLAASVGEDARPARPTTDDQPRMRTTILMRTDAGAGGMRLGLFAQRQHQLDLVRRQRGEIAQPIQQQLGAERPAGAARIGGRRDTHGQFA